VLCRSQLASPLFLTESDCSTIVMGFSSSLVARRKRHSNIGNTDIHPVTLPSLSTVVHHKSKRSTTNKRVRNNICITLIIFGLISVLLKRRSNHHGPSGDSFPTSFLVKYKVSPQTVWWSNYAETLSRVYQPRPNSTWCIPETTPTHEWRLNEQNEAVGLIYIKTYKASSSTAEGVSLSIAHNVGKRLPSTWDDSSQRKKPASACIHYNRHVFQDIGGLQYRASSRAVSLIWTMVRHPIERDLSSFYFFEVSRKVNVTVTDQLILDKFRSYKGFQTSYLLPWQTNPWGAGKELLVKADQGKRSQVLEWMSTKIFDEYDFIGITERFDESLAVMVLLWDLETTDVIVLSAKQAGGYDDAGHTGRCSKIIRPEPPSPAVKEYWSHEHAVDNADFLLWDAANLSLDRTIQQLGVERVGKVVEEIQNLRKLAEYWCAHKAYFPCNSRGQKQLKLSEKSCYVQDAGCGYSCVDKIMTKYKLGQASFITKDTVSI
jgi:hypothetical protein